MPKGTEHDPFLDDPTKRLALAYILDGVFDGDENPGVQKLARSLCDEPFMAELPDSQRSIVALQAASRAHEVIDDVTYMEMTVNKW